MDAARILRSARRRSGLTQRQLAKIAVVPQPQIARIESGVSIPRVDTLDWLLEACGEGLEALPRPGIGVDRSMYPNALARSPRERIQQAGRDAAHNNRVLAAVRQEKAIENINFLEALERFARAGVQFVLVGGVAGRLHGSNIVTVDLDLCCSWEQQNLERVLAVLSGMDATQLGTRSRLVRVRTLERMDRATFETTLGPVDTFRRPPGFLRGYEELERAAEDVHLDGFSIKVPNLDDLIRMDRAIGRPRNLWIVENLGALRDHIDAQAAEERKGRRKNR